MGEYILAMELGPKETGEGAGTGEETSRPGRTGRKKRREDPLGSSSSHQSDAFGQIAVHSFAVTKRKK